MGAVCLCARRDTRAKGIDERVVQSGYFFTTAREYGKRVAPRLMTRHELGAILQPLFDLVASGRFLHLQKGAKGDRCSYREFDRLCDGECVTPSKWKKALTEISTKSFADEAVSRWFNV